MKPYFKISILLCLILCLLFCGCGKRGKVSSGGDLSTDPGESTEFHPAASGGDQQFLASTEALLLDGNGEWRSEQQGPEDEVVTVRELVLLPDKSFAYKEGDWASEFCYFAEGSWTLTEDVLDFQFTETDEFGAAVDKAAHKASFGVSFDGDMLLLTQQSAEGFCGSEQGIVLYFFHPIV